MSDLMKSMQENMALRQANIASGGVINQIVQNDIEKGKSLPVGTIKKRGPNNFIKTATGWKYHSRAGGSTKKVEKDKGVGDTKKSTLTVSKLMGNHGTDYSLTVSTGKDEVIQYVAKTVEGSSSKFDLFKKNGVNETLVKQSITLSEAKSVLIESEKKEKKEKVQQKADPKKVTKGNKLVDQLNDASEKGYELRDQSSYERSRGNINTSHKLDERAQKWETKSQEYGQKLDEMYPKLNQAERDDIESHYGVDDLWDNVKDQ